MKNKFTLLIAICIMASFSFISCDEDDPIIAAKAGFEYAPTENINAGDTIQFTNSSTNAESYSWSFGDGSNSTEFEPIHVYAEEGEYTVTLVSKNSESTDSISKSIAIAVKPAAKEYIINYGNYSGEKSTISKYNVLENTILNKYYESVNGVSMSSNIQYAYLYEDNIMMMGNNADEVFFVEAETFEQKTNGITTDITKPRYCVAQGNFLYVSCWGGDIWDDITLSYIAKIDLDQGAVVKKITLHGGPEGLAIANNKLYAALNYMDSVAVIDLNSEAVSYIETPAVSTYFEQDNDGNLYVSLISSYSKPSDVTGIGFINTTTDELEEVYNLEGVSSSYVDIMAPNADFSKLYVMTSAYDENWNLSGAIATFDVASKSFESDMFITGVSSLNGVGLTPDDEVFVFIAPSGENGKAQKYSTDGTFIEEYETGISPFMLLTVE